MLCFVRWKMLPSGEKIPAVMGEKEIDLESDGSVLSIEYLDSFLLVCIFQVGCFVENTLELDLFYPV